MTLFAEERAFLARHPRLLAALLCAVCLVLGFLWGRSSVAVRTRVETRTVEVEKVRTVEVVKRVEVAASSSSGGVVIHRVVEKSTCAGGNTERTTEDIREGHQAQETTQATAEASTVRVEYRDRVVEKVVEKTSEKPQWRAGVLAGADVRKMLTGAPLGQSWLLGGEVERRVAGPFSVGLWGLSNGTGGLRASVEW